MTIQSKLLSFHGVKNQSSSTNDSDYHRSKRLESQFYVHFCSLYTHLHNVGFQKIEDVFSLHQKSNPLVLGARMLDKCVPDKSDHGKICDPDYYTVIHIRKR